jgi:hypothetical protein
MAFDKRPKIVSPSGKHEPYQLSIVDFHVLQSRLSQFIQRLTSYTGGIGESSRRLFAFLAGGQRGPAAPSAANG